jgi:hypothetical protein
MHHGTEKETHTYYMYSGPAVYIHIYIKVKVKFTLQQATKAQRGSRGIALLFL